MSGSRSLWALPECLSSAQTPFCAAPVGPFSLAPSSHLVLEKGVGVGRPPSHGRSLPVPARSLSPHRSPASLATPRGNQGSSVSAFTWAETHLTFN